VQFAHGHDRGVGQVHPVVPAEERADARPVRSEVEGQAQHVTLDQLEERIEAQAVFPQEVRGLGEDCLARQEGRTHLLHPHDRPRVVGIVAIEIDDERSRVADRGHDLQRRRLASVAARRLPARLPPRSAALS
jgi:hypothetical protein